MKFKFLIGVGVACVFGSYSYAQKSSERLLEVGSQMVCNVNGARAAQVLLERAQGESLIVSLNMGTLEERHRLTLESEIRQGQILTFSGVDSQSRMNIQIQEQDSDLEARIEIENLHDGRITVLNNLRCR